MAKFSVRKPLTVFVVVLAILILGIVAGTRMTPDLLPNMDFPYVVIMTTYPGASPETVEAEVTKPLEQSMATLEHIKSVSSTSGENYSMVMLEFEESVNLDTVGVDIQQSITALSGSWDDMVGAPYVLKINPSMLPVEVAAVSMEGMDVIELTEFVDEVLMTELEGTPGVASISASGMVDRQVHVVISQDKIDDVNARMAGAVTEKLEETRAELEDTKAELEEAQKELESAQNQLDSGTNALVDQTAAAEAEISAQQIALLEGKMELQQPLVTLNQTQSGLEASLTVLRPLWETTQQLEAREAELTARIEALEAARDRLNAADAALAAYGTPPSGSTGTAPLPEITIPDVALPEVTLPEVTTSEDTTFEDTTSEDTTFEDTTAEDTTAEDTTSEDTTSEDTTAEDTTAEDTTAEDTTAEDTTAEDTTAEDTTEDIPAGNFDQAGYEAALAEVKAAEAELEALGSSRETVTADIVAAQAERTQIHTSLATLDATLADMDMTREDLSAAIGEMEAGLLQAEEGIALLNETLAQLEAGEIELTAALETLSGSTSAGLLELANASTQIAVNSSTVAAALEQVESGLETLDDSKADALRQADLTGTLTLQTVSSLLEAQNFSMPAGYVEENGVRYMVSVGDAITEQEDLETLLLFDTGEDAIGPIYLSDVADIFLTDNAADSYTKLNGENGVTLTFEKQSNAATAEVCDELEDTFRRLEEEHKGLTFVSLMDQGSYIYMIIQSILESLITGMIFSILILFLFLRDIRPTIITVIAIPVSVIFAIVLMYFSGVTLNMISLSGLAVAVGMLVDNSIVVIENIYRLRAKGASATQAAVAGAKQVAGAITASTLTTVCVFLPIVFVEGITKQLFTDLALSMGYALMASLFIALTMVPAMAKGLFKDRKRKKKHERHAVSVGEGRFYLFYRRAIAWSLDHKTVVLLASVVLLVASAALALNRGFSYMPEVDMNTVSLTVTMPEDTDMDTASDLADQVLERVMTLENVESVGAMMGESSLLSTGASQSYDVTMYITLPEGDSGAEAGKRITALCQDLDCRLSYSSALIDMSYLSGSGISLYLYGNDMEDLQSAARMTAQALSELDGVAETNDGLEEAEDALHVTVDKNAAMEKGWTVAQLYMEISQALTESSIAMTLDVESTTADVLVEKGDAMTREALTAMTFDYTDREGNELTFHLDEVADLEETVSLASISRSDQRRYLSVTASIAEGYNVTKVSADARSAMAALDLPEGVTYEFSGENETILEALGQLLLMLLIGIALVYFVMVAQFQSLKSPFIVMFTIPLAFTGGFMALLLCGMDVSIISLIGFIMLTGIIVNNGIVLIDYINQLRADGVARRQAIMEAGVTRLRPILMTSLTTILGLVMMAFGKDAGTALMQPLAVVCIGGLLYATVMTLFVIPCIYDMMNKKDIRVLTDEDLEFEEL